GDPQDVGPVVRVVTKAPGRKVMVKVVGAELGAGPVLHVAGTQGQPVTGIGGAGGGEGAGARQAQARIQRQLPFQVLQVAGDQGVHVAGVAPAAPGQFPEGQPVRTAAEVEV